MYIGGVLPRVAGAALVAFVVSHVAAAAQDQQGEQGHDMANMPGMQHDASQHETATSMRDGSGTSWLPDDTPMYALHWQSRGWTLMGHGSAFLQYLHESGREGIDQAGSVNWLMGMASRAVGAGHFMLRGMASAEPWTIRGCGYPDLLATGEVCRGVPIHDRQHPHDVFMEFAAEYDRPLAGGTRWQLYGGPVGEPALGPVAVMHRISALPNPVAAISHHWFDATHISYGVVTGGLYGTRWKAETSLFNGREPDATRTDFDFGAMDSWSGRLWFLPARTWALQVSAGRLTEAESGEDGGPRIDVTRATASATYHRTLGPTSVWATTIGWGHNAERRGAVTSAALVETSLTLDDRDTWFGRFEVSGKAAHDLDVPGVNRVFTVAKLQAGYTRYAATWKRLKPGIGALGSMAIVSSRLAPVYGARTNAGFGVFLTLRPAMMAMQPAAK